MKTLKNKTTYTLIASILILTITATSIFVALPSANAHTPPWNVPTSAYVSVAPGTIGVGQHATIVVWVDRFSPTGTGISGQRFTGYQINITKPDGKTVIIGPWTCASSVGSDFQVYTPDEPGTYSIVFSWPGNVITNGTGEPLARGLPMVGDFFEGSTSKPCTLTVLQSPIPSWQEPPLPTDYWTRPINAANRGWSTLPSNWLKGSWLVNNFQDQGTGPLTAHILWSKPIIPGYTGGIIDGRWPTIPADVNDYESPWSAPIIMDGKIYYNAPAVADSSQHGYYAVSLYTGEQLWYKNGTDNGLNNPYTIGTTAVDLTQSYVSLTQGQLYHYNSVNGQGVLSYLIMVKGNTWYYLDATTGNLIFTLINVPSGTAVTDQDGSLLRYSYNANTGNILCWNSSQSIRPLGPTGSSQQQWKPPLGAVIDAVNDTAWTKAGPSLPSDTELWTVNDILPRSGYTMNVTSASLKGLPGGITAILQDDNHVPKQIFGSNIVVTSTTAMSVLGAPCTADAFSVWLVSIDDHVTGYNPPTAATNTQANNLGFGATLLFNKNITVPLPGLNYTWAIAAVDYDSQTFQLHNKQLGQSWCYSLTTGNLMWGPTISFNQMDYYGVTQNVFYGKLIQISQYGGTMAAYDVTDGKLLWVYNATAPGFESAYGSNMPLSLGAVVDGTAILYSSEHSPTKPLWRESDVRCVNLTDGTLIWKLLDFNMGLSIADGYIVTGNEYDNNVYCIGKGPSQTTVSAPQNGVPLGSSFTITGTVTDQSPGAKETAAIADADQEAWMEYLYEQQVMPTNANGVPVTIDAVDPNGNFVNFGTATNNLNGVYGLTVNTNDLAAGPGLYEVIATFAGSNSYGSSYATSFFTVNSAPTVAPTAAPVTDVARTSDLIAYMTVGVIAIIIAIAIVGFLILRKHP